MFSVVRRSGIKQAFQASLAFQHLSLRELRSVFSLSLHSL